MRKRIDLLGEWRQHIGHSSLCHDQSAHQNRINICLPFILEIGVW